jgi:hypothetical protein
MEITEYCKSWSMEMVSRRAAYHSIGDQPSPGPLGLEPYSEEDLAAISVSLTASGGRPIGVYGVDACTYVLGRSIRSQQPLAN